jgi:hypothetical protein
MVRAAILDDYQNVAMHFADWSSIAKDVEIKVFNKPFASQDEAIRALQGFAVVVGMRERTPFPRKVIEALPDLKLLITTGARNNSFDVKACAERGVTVCGTGATGSPTTGIHRLEPKPDRGQGESCRRGLRLKGRPVPQLRFRHDPYCAE